MKFGPTGPVSRRVRRVLFAAAALVGLWLLSSWVVAYRLTHRKHPPFPEPPPAVAWGTLEPHRLATRDGQSIGAWLARGDDGAPSVLLVHGNGGSREQCVPLAATYAAEGCTVLLITVRAHGDSTGELNDLGYGARHDVVAAVEFLERLRPGRPVLIHGTSLGAGAAAFASGELARRARGYVLECPYRDLKTALWNRTESYLPPVLDRLAYGGLVAVAPLVLPHVEAIAPVEAVAGIPEGVPVLILAGGRDVLARPEEARAIRERLKDRATLVIFGAAGHLRLPDAEPDRYRAEVVAFLRSVARAR